MAEEDLVAVEKGLKACFLTGIGSPTELSVVTNLTGRADF